MENPAHVYTTGIPMSEKGKFSHYGNGCGESSTLTSIHINKSDDHNYLSNSNLILSDSNSDNAEFVNNTIQNGFQSEILCNFVCSDDGLQSSLSMGESSNLEDESMVETDACISFPESPNAFHDKIESFSSMEGLVPSLDEQFENYLLAGFKENKNEPKDGEESLEDEQRNVTEAICDIAKSFGFEDLLPDTFQVDNNKDSICVTVASDVLCEDNDVNTSELQLGDFGKCPDLHSPGSLNLVEHLEDDANDYALNGLEIISTSKSKSLENGDNNIVPSTLKVFENRKTVNKVSSEISNIKSSKTRQNDKSEKSNVIVPALDNNASLTSDHVRETGMCELPADIPTVSISDVQIDGCEVYSNCPPAGTVLITTDKASKKMQIVLTLEQGQQIYDIDTESVDAGDSALDLNLSSSISDENIQASQSMTDSDSVVIENVEISTDVDFENQKEVIGVKSVDETFVDYVSNMPVPVSKSKKKKVWICPVESCGQVLDKECKLRVHMISHKGVRPYKCTYEGCDWAFTTFYRLKRHVETHLGSKDYICDFEGCNRKFTTVYNLKTHKKLHKWPLMCPSQDCKLSFSNRRKLELHLRVHEDVEAPYKCSLCGKQYYSANCLASHYRTHQYNEDDFKCPFQGCGKVYDKICRLRQHVRHHTGDRPYVCPAEGCKWSFMSASKLTRHMRKHTGERKFVCTEPGCGKSFMRPEHLKGHIVIHSGDKPFHCPHENCNARFTAKSSLYVHVKKHCSSVLKVVYPCPVASCMKKYNNKATLKQHLQKFHPETVQDGKQIGIKKLELIMPVSVVNSDNSLGFLESDEDKTDDPSSDLKVQFLQSTDKTFCISPVSLDTESIVLDTSDVTNKISKSACVLSVPSDASKKAKSKNVPKSKLLQVNHSGCARTDFSCNPPVAKEDAQINLIYLNQNSNENSEVRNFLSNMSTDIKSPDVMLTSSVMFNDNPSEHYIKNHFSPEDSSTNHSLYHDDSILVNSAAFGTELIPDSLLSDNSVDNSGGIVFTEQNGVDAFAESMHLHGLD